MSDEIPATQVLREYQLEVALVAANEEIKFLRKLVLLLAPKPKKKVYDE